MADASTTISEIESTEEYEKLISLCGDQVLVLNFYAEWANPCKYMNNVFKELSIKFSNIKFANVKAEELEEISESFGVTVVPFFVILQSGKVLGKLSGANPSELTEMVTRFSTQLHLPLEKQGSGVSTQEVEGKSHNLYTTHEKDENIDLTSRLKKLVEAEPIMLFMKGTPTNPQCGFSRQIVNILNEHHIKYGFFNILADERVREGLKEFSDWPTYPQLYIRGNFCGGLDIVREMFNTGEIQQLLQQTDILST
ncbi:Grx4 family monothiol glutaredoxin [Pneumocystis carinii B80]|uniref:Grx4 family monothiol glutaredoxin n=1 Tax=Pneumocystis carinii (strain B80) TaxID=1408658 RepID=A0A0W4ZLP9_PNEC8|nr:Grx4 family monothiol glutaredoxin [Pneumocystis carinii B80]KTW29299.1 Grx4 family monothiol glutaredoxin [Pneumocystis carinii B80]